MVDQVDGDGKLSDPGVLLASQWEIRTNCQIGPLLVAGKQFTPSSWIAAGNKRILLDTSGSSVSHQRLFGVAATHRPNNGPASARCLHVAPYTNFLAIDENGVLAVCPLPGVVIVQATVGILDNGDGAVADFASGTRSARVFWSVHKIVKTGALCALLIAAGAACCRGTANDRSARFLCQAIAIIAGRTLSTGIFRAMGEVVSGITFRTLRITAACARFRCGTRCNLGALFLCCGSIAVKTVMIFWVVAVVPVLSAAQSLASGN